MASDNDNSRLVDLLYDDELDEQTAQDARRQVEESPDQRDELEANEAFLDQVREHTDNPSVSSELHEAIVDHARQEADRRTEATAADQARPDSRGPRAVPDEGSSLWTQIDRSSLTQLAAAAVAIMASGYLLYNMSASRSPQTASQEPRMAQQLPESDESAAEASGEELAEAEPEPQPTKEEPDREPAAFSEADEQTDQTEQTDPPDEAGEAADDSLAGEKLAKGPQPERQVKKRAEQPSPRTDKKKAVPKKSADQTAEPNLDDTPTGGKVAEAKPKPRPPSGATREGTAGKKQDSRRRSGAEAPDLMKDDSAAEPLGFINGDADEPADRDSAADREQAQAPTQPKSEGADNKAVADMIQGGAESSGSGASADNNTDEDTAPVDEAEDAEAAAPTEAEPRQQAKAKSGKQAGEQADGIPALVDRVEAAYQKRSWSDVSHIAEQALPKASGRQAARLRELRARALAKQGDTDAAVSAWQTLRAKHPDYKPKIVQGQLDALRSNEK